MGAIGGVPASAVHYVKRTARSAVGRLVAPGECLRKGLGHETNATRAQFWNVLKCVEKPISHELDSPLGERDHGLYNRCWLYYPAHWCRASC